MSATLNLNNFIFRFIFSYGRWYSYHLLLKLGFQYISYTSSVETVSSYLKMILSEIKFSCG